MQSLAARVKRAEAALQETDPDAILSIILYRRGKGFTITRDGSRETVREDLAPKDGRLPRVTLLCRPEVVKEWYPWRPA